MEYLEDIKGADHLGSEWGERFNSWYRSCVFNRTETVPLQDGLTYQLKVCDYQYRFIMPPRLEFHRGLGDDGKILANIISYSEPERLLGIFRFPQNPDGTFSSPLSIKKTEEDVINLSIEELQELVSKKKVLTFEAFRIPFFGFQYFSIADSDFEEIAKIAGEKVSSLFRSTYENHVNTQVEEIKTRIMTQPNFLLILQNTLDLHWKNEAEIATMTGGILHFGI